MVSHASKVPTWVAALRGEGDLPFRWLEPEDAATRRDLLREVWELVPFADDFKAHGAERIARSIPVALGPARRARVGERQEELTLLVDPERPEDLLAALGERIPPSLWIPLGRTAASIRAGLAPYLTEEQRSVHRFSRVQRVFKGTAEQLGLEGLDALMEILTLSETWLDPAFWSSAHEDDPWPADASSLSMLQLRRLMETNKELHPGQFAAFSFRTLWSRSVLRVEEHIAQSFVFELRYEPSRHPEVLRDLQERLPLPIPEDMPVDLVASLLRGPTVTQGALRGVLQQNGPAPFLALAQCALDPGGTAALEVLRAMLSEPRLQGVAVELANSYGYVGLLHEVLASTGDDELKEQLEHHLVPRVEVPDDDGEGEEGADDDLGEEEDEDGIDEDDDDLGEDDDDFGEDDDVFGEDDDDLGEDDDEGEGDEEAGEDEGDDDGVGRGEVKS